MHIALILPNPPGYSETFFKSKIRGLQTSGHEVILVTGANTETFGDCKHKRHPKVYTSVWRQSAAFIIVGLSLLPHLAKVFRYIRLERKNKTTLKRIVEKVYINATLLKLKVNWLHFGFATMAIERELVAEAIKAKMGVSFRGYDINVYPLKNKEVYKLLWEQVDKVHSISNDLLDRAYALGLPKDKTFRIITPAIKTEALPVKTNNAINKPIKIVTIARLHYIKGIDILLETAAKLRDKQLDFIWEVIGSGDQKAEERYLYQRYRLGLEAHVTFSGKLSHKKTLEALQSAELYVQTSLIEGFCNAVLEAQGLGKLTLAFDSGGLRENILDGETGFLAPICDAKVMANTIERVLGLSNKEKQNIQKQAGSRVKTHFSLEQQQQAFVEFYTT
ncbi:glycosyltransferase family 4 protein [Aestuariibaculum marinum]|uniref:Glycosyltransferase family 4 protein n=1 Tax=Aestuariibaculum marinum TaxID=2683592 RepID=A0A8J6PT59_9FLAO|nr:glycosyltransferase family 4 protein [Aestuariibaculum marinum]MBD0823879.1 glycosyltransferase family 4 protein [Aestuariibaculum marinum]